MAQTPAKPISGTGCPVDYTPTNAVGLGEVVVLGNAVVGPAVIGVAMHPIAGNALGAIETEGIFDLPKDASVFALGAVVYWNAAGTDLGNNTGSAGVTNTLPAAGKAVKAAINTDTHVRVKINV